ncbi:arabinose efflux permease family protein [Sporocytophaga myxococcoides]|uniref:Arabinose efflux permease family protein n=1 Tax=Sporocytophaga myxococcoides TaxID=153721 RepID=A0A098LJ95_9BACT|nr:MFS transporter [Sporocytophaga myxococcoides]GAL86223.1 arabinose efflux permease family protein [Sporocytophaga myxococcoides]
MKNTEDLAASKEAAQSTVMVILIGISFSHMLNDTIQSLIPSIYPLVKNSLDLSFAQLGLITLTFQLTSSVLQPFVGYYTDLNPKPNSLAVGMGFTLIGLILLSLSTTYPMILASVGLVGVGSAIFHPEASRLAYMASGGKRGFAQSLFQVGGNAGSAIGPLLAASIVVPYGQSKIIWFSLIALIAIIVLFNLGIWYRNNGLNRIKKHKKESEARSLPKWTVIFSLGILIILIFSKYFYMASMSSYFTFYLINKFQVSVQAAQVYLFIFLVSVAAGTLVGGPVGDKIGRKYVIWISILGVAPFTLLLPYANLEWTAVLISCIGFILSSAFSAILVYAQELVPGKVGMISGLFFGLAFAMGGIGSAILGKLADITGIEYVFHLCSFLPLIGLITAFLPNLEKK